MAAFTHAVATASTSNTNLYTTGAFTPAADDLLVAVGCTSGYTLSVTPSDSQSLGWYEIASAVYVSTQRKLWLFVANAKAAASSMTFSITTEPDTFASGGIVAVTRLSSMLRVGSAALRQSAKTENGAISATPTATFAAACLTGNPTIAALAIALNPPVTTEPSGWTEQVESGYNTPANGVEYATRASGFTGTQVDWGFVAANQWGTIIAEFDVNPPPTSRAYFFD